MMRFSLIVCTLGRRDELSLLFDSLIRQNRDDFEVILIDQNTDDRLVDIAAKFSERFPLRHVRMNGTGLSRARNLGLEHAAAELIGFPDDDCIYLDSYLAAVDRIFTEEPSVGCISGHPTAELNGLGTDWQTGRMDLDAVTVLNRCQEFTVFVRKDRLRNLRYNDLLGVGAQTLWGADEGPDFLIRLAGTGCRLVYFPRLFVYHPDKIAIITRATLSRAASYARGRGCLFRLHRFPKKMVFNSLFRPAGGIAVYLLRLQPMRSAYYLTVCRGILRGLMMSNAELTEVQNNTRVAPESIQPMDLPPLPTQPLVSVLIASFNYARFLPAALDSLLAQTYGNWQAVVCDDGSTDNSAEIARQYTREDLRIELVEKPNGGQTSTVNECFRHLRGKIICLLDADDVFDPGKIQSVVDAFTSHQAAGMCNHFVRVIDGDGNPLPITMNTRLDSGWLANQALQRGACVYVPTTSAMSFRRELADQLFPIPDRQRRDVDGYLGMVAQFLAPLVTVDAQMGGYRVHGSNMGGLTEPTLPRLHYELRLIEERTTNVKEFVRERFGDDIARPISIEDNPQYIQAALKLLAVEKAGPRLSRALPLIRRHPNAKWRAIWRTIFAAPGPVSRLAVPMMHRSYRLKAVMHRLISRGKAVVT